LFILVLPSEVGAALNTVPRREYGKRWWRTTATDKNHRTATYAYVDADRLVVSNLPMGSNGTRNVGEQSGEQKMPNEACCTRFLASGPIVSR